MEPTAAQLMTAYEAFTDAGGEMDIDGPFTGNQAAIEAAVRAAFAAGPDPIKLAESWETDRAEEDADIMDVLAAELRTFMRGDGK